MRTAVKFRPFSPALLEHAADAILRDGDLLDLALAHEGLEIAVGDRLARLEGEDEGLASASRRRKPSAYHMAADGPVRGVSRRPGLLPRGSDLR